MEEGKVDSDREEDVADHHKEFDHENDPGPDGKKKIPSGFSEVESYE